MLLPIGLREGWPNVAITLWSSRTRMKILPEYRLLLEPRDSSWLEPIFPVTGGSVRVQQTQPFGPSTYYVSPANPFVSKLAGLAIEVIRDGAELVIARYFEPYGVAGYLAAQATGAKLVLSHSGSDLELLMRSLNSQRSTERCSVLQTRS